MADVQYPVVPLYPESYPQTIAPDKQERKFSDSPYAIINVHYPTLDVYLPEPAAATGCGVVICPGGGYWVLATEHEGSDIARWLNSLGVAAFVLKHRVPPDYRHPVPMQDTVRAMRLVRANAGKWGLKPDRIGVMGFSAGAHLAALVATRFDSGDAQSPDAVERESCRPDFQVLAYPVISFIKDYCKGPSRPRLIGETPSEQLKRDLSAELHVTPQTPPAFVFQSSDDDGVDPRNSTDLCVACQLNKVPVELHIFPTGGHGFGMGKSGTSESQWPGLMAKWLEQLGMLKR